MCSPTTHNRSIHDKTFDKFWGKCPSTLKVVKFLEAALLSAGLLWYKLPENNFYMSCTSITSGN